MQKLVSELTPDVVSAVGDSDEPCSRGLRSAQLKLLYTQTPTGVISSIMAAGLLAI
ncbi:MAG: hypothetical protein ACI915_000860 [Gammaproteobacteria bacterium]|jgi:hypothetical protein